MNQPLVNCAISGPLKNPASDFAATAASLLYQSSTLGMEIECNDKHGADNALSFEFKTPYTEPIVCEVTHWDNSNQQAVATENIIQAACGVMSVHGRAIGKAQPLGVNYVSTLTAALALQGGVAAALGQLRGLAVKNSYVSMASAGLLSVAQYIAGATATESPESLVPDNLIPCAAPPFVSSDGVIFELETLDAEPWLKFWIHLGVSSSLAGKGWTAFLLRYAKAISPIPDELINTISNVTYSRIVELCSLTGMAICPVHAIDERVSMEKFKYEWLNGPWAFHQGPVLNNIQQQPISNGLPLSGLTVIESCRRIQGPLTGHLLAFLGAEVIRIEPPGGDPLRGMPPMAEGCSARFDALNRLKTIREVDIKSLSGQAEIKEMVRKADVFLHNWAPGKAAQLNLDYDDVVKLNPSLIYAYAAGWATHRSASSALNSMPGTDFMTQAYSGVAQKISKTSGTKGGSLFTVLDVLGGVVAAQGITIALLNRCMNKVGSRITSSLLSSAIFLCAEDYQKLHRAFDIQSISKNLIAGVYATQLGKIAIDCPDTATKLQLAKILDITMETEDTDLQQKINKLFLLKTAHEWLAILQHANIPAAVVIENLEDLQNSPRLIAHLRPGAYTQVISPWSFK